MRLSYGSLAVFLMTFLHLRIFTPDINRNRRQLLSRARVRSMWRGKEEEEDEEEARAPEDRVGRPCTLAVIIDVLSVLMYVSDMDDPDTTALNYKDTETCSSPFTLIWFI